MPEKKPEQPDVYIAKTHSPSLEEMKLQLQLKQAEIELLKLKSHQENSNIYG
jgi:hypothetical protein